MKYQPIDRPSSRLKWRMNSMFAFQENIVAASLEYIDFSNISLPRSEQPAKLFMEIRKYFSIKQTLRSPIDIVHEFVTLSQNRSLKVYLRILTHDVLN